MVRYHYQAKLASPLRAFRVVEGAAEPAGHRDPRAVANKAHQVPRLDPPGLDPTQSGSWVRSRRHTAQRALSFTCGSDFPAVRNSWTRTSEATTPISSTWFVAPHTAPPPGALALPALGWASSRHHRPPGQVAHLLASVVFVLMLIAPRSPQVL